MKINAQNGCFPSFLSLNFLSHHSITSAVPNPRRVPTFVRKRRTVRRSRRSSATSQCRRPKLSLQLHYDDDDDDDENRDGWRATDTMERTASVRSIR